MVKLSEKDRKFNRNIFAGLIGGLIVIWSQIALDELVVILSLPDHYITKIFGTLILGVFLFVLIAISHPFFGQKLYKKE